jgi:hypothetical protein
MPSFAGAFPDARLLLSLDSEQLAGFFLFYFRSLPWRDECAVRRCIAHWVRPYPDDVRERLAAALQRAWALLDADGFLSTAARTPRSTSRAEIDRLHA